MAEKDKDTGVTRQQEHAMQVKNERYTMRNLGVTREQARKVLTENATQLREQAQAQKKAQVVENDPPKAPAPTITVEITKFDPKPLTLGIDPAPRQQDGDGMSGPITGIKRVIIVDNGTANYYDIAGNFIEAV